MPRILNGFAGGVALPKLQRGHHGGRRPSKDADGGGWGSQSGHATRGEAYTDRDFYTMASVLVGLGRQ